MIVLRPFKSSDVEEAAKVHFESWQFVSSMYRPDEVQYFPLEKFQKNWQDFCADPHGKEALLATENCKIVGLVRYSEDVKPNTEDWHIQDRILFDKAMSQKLGQLHQFYILPSHTRRNIGSMLCLEALLDMAKAETRVALIERNIDNTLSAEFQHKRLLSKDIATYPDLDLRKGQYGAPRDITSTDVMAYTNVIRAIINLRHYMGSCVRVR